MKKHDTWASLVKHNYIKYVDNSEVENYVIAMLPLECTVPEGKESKEEERKSPHRLNFKDMKNFIQVYDYCEIHPSMMMGIIGNIIPFPDHNQCIYEKEPVCMSDGTVKSICDVEVGDEVITFDPSNQKQTVATVTYTCTRATNKKIQTIKTISGRKITATFDHKFMTKAGWLRLENVGIYDEEKTCNNSLIGISLEPLPVSTQVKEYTVLCSGGFTNTCKLMGTGGIPSVDRCLDEIKHLLPLKSTDDSLIILARIFGFCLTDVWIGISDIYKLTVNFSSKYSAELFNLDVTRLGFVGKTPTKVGSTQWPYRLEYSGAFPTLLVIMGCELGGKNTRQKYRPVPKWILNGSDMIKREFLAGFQGGDGSPIKLYRKSHICINKTIRSVKEEHHKESLHLFMTQIVDLLRHFDIKVADVSLKRWSSDMIIGSYLISSKRVNLIKYYDTIGYRYNVRKHVESGIFVEYLKYINIA